MASIDLRVITLLKIGTQAIFSLLLIRLLLKHQLDFESVMRPIVIAGYASFLELGVSRTAVDYSVLIGKSFFKEFLGLLVLVLSLVSVLLLMIFGFNFHTIVGILLLVLTMLNIMLYQHEEYTFRTKNFQLFAFLNFAFFSLILFSFEAWNVPIGNNVFIVAVMPQLLIVLKFIYRPKFSLKILKLSKQYLIKNAVWSILLFSTITIARELAIQEGNLKSVEIGMKMGLLISSFMVSATFHLYSHLALNKLSNNDLIRIVSLKGIFYLIFFLIFGFFLENIVGFLFSVVVDSGTVILFSIMFSFPTIFDVVLKWMQVEAKRARIVNMLRFFLLIIGGLLFIFGNSGNFYLFGQLIMVPLFVFGYFLVKNGSSTV